MRKNLVATSSETIHLVSEVTDLNKTSIRHRDALQCVGQSEKKQGTALELMSAHLKTVIGDCAKKKGRD